VRHSASVPGSLVPILAPSLGAGAGTRAWPPSGEQGEFQFTYTKVELEGREVSILAGDGFYTPNAFCLRKLVPMPPYHGSQRGAEK